VPPRQVSVLALCNTRHRGEVRVLYFLQQAAPQRRGLAIQPLDPKPVNVNRLLASMEDLLRRTMGERIRVEVVLSAGLWTTLCDATSSKTRTGLKVLFMTGYAENATLAEGVLEPGMEIITKPFAMDKLASRVVKMLGSQATA